MWPSPRHRSFRSAPYITLSSILLVAEPHTTSIILCWLSPHEFQKYPSSSIISDDCKPASHGKSSIRMTLRRALILSSNLLNNRNTCKSVFLKVHPVRIVSASHGNDLLQFAIGHIILDTVFPICSDGLFPYTSLTRNDLPMRLRP